MENEDLWQTFAATGRVEDYLRYRGMVFPENTAGVEKEAAAYGDRPKTAFDDRRPDSAGI